MVLYNIKKRKVTFGSENNKPLRENKDGNNNANSKEREDESPRTASTKSLHRLYVCIIQ